MMTSCDSLFALLGVLLVNISGTEGNVKCLKDSQVSEKYDANIYFCSDPAKPQCCQQNNQPSCCEDPADKSFKNQFELWGLLGVVVVAVAFILVCWRKDTYLCEGSTMKERCSNLCNCRRKKKVEDDGAIELAVRRTNKRPGSDKYRQPSAKQLPTSANSSKREATTVTSLGIKPTFLNQQEIHHNSDIDSGRGSVTSSSPPSNEISAKSSATHFRAHDWNGRNQSRLNSAVSAEATDGAGADVNEREIGEESATERDNNVVVVNNGKTDAPSKSAKKKKVPTATLR